MQRDEHDPTAAATAAKPSCAETSEGQSTMAISQEVNASSSSSSSSSHHDGSKRTGNGDDAVSFVDAADAAGKAMSRDKTRSPSAATYTVDALSGQITFHGRRALRAYAQSRQMLWQRGSLPHKPCLVLYEGGVYDVSEFVHAHPGGEDVLAEFHTGDISAPFHDGTHYHAHSRSALSVLYQYRVGSLDGNGDDDDDDDDDKDTVAARRTTTDKTNGVDDALQPPAPPSDGTHEYPIITPRAIFYRGFTIRRDRGLMWQAIHLPLDQYIQFVDQPVFLLQCRLFDSDAFELLTRTKYWVVPLLWLPLSAFWFARGVLRDNTQLNEQWGSCLDRFLYYPNNNWAFHNYPAPVTAHMAATYVHGTTPEHIAHEQLAHARAVSAFSIVYPVMVFLLGLSAWTPLEYCLHRFAFHYDRLLPRSLMDNPVAKWVHLVLHGIHHIIPMDRDRLVFPPALFAVMAVVIYNLVGLLMTGSCLDLVAAGLTLGYVFYDEIHFHIHHVKSSTAYFNDLRHYHHAHHYTDSTRGFGVTNKLWDWVFNTMLHVKS